MDRSRGRRGDTTRPDAAIGARVLQSLVDSVVSVFRGWGRGYHRLAESHGASVAGDALVGVALAGTLLFDVPSTEARENVALYLLVTLAPFAVLGPILGRVFERAPGAYRAGLVVSSVGRTVVAVALVFAVETWLVFPLGFALLVLSRFHGIARSSVLPVVVRNTDELIDANARLARAGVIAASVVVPIGAAVSALAGPGPALVAAAVLYVVSAWAASQLPPVSLPAEDGRGSRYEVPRAVRLARFATAGVRFLSGYLVLLVAFAFGGEDTGIGRLGVLLASAGLGYFLAAWIAPAVGRYVREEPMVVGALAVMAMAAFIGAQALSLIAAGVLAAAAGFAWGMAKFAFDAMMHATVPTRERGKAFTIAESMFQTAWVMGALIPVLPFWPTELGLSSAGVLALIIQVGYVSLVLVPESVRHHEPSPERAAEPDPDIGILDFI